MEEEVEYRKLQQVGRGSYIVTLPKGWIQDLELKKGSHIAIKRRENSSLLVTPREVWEEKGEKTAKEYTIQADPQVNPQALCRKIASLYVVSTDLIHIRFKGGKIPTEHRSAVTELTKGELLGSEIISERDGRITIQILVKHPDFPIEKAIRRMSLLALSAQREAIQTLKKVEGEKSKGIPNLCNDVNRLNLYVIRQLKYGLDRDLFKEFGFKTRKEFLGYRIVANAIKSIADNALNVVNNIKALKEEKGQTLITDKRINEGTISQLLEFNSKAQKFFEEALKALFSRRYTLADRLLSERKNLVDSENELSTMIAFKKMTPNISAIFRLILDSSRRIVEHGQSIAEVALHRTVEEEGETVSSETK